MFYQEHLDGIQPAGATQQTRQSEGAITIPEGTYDIGEGFLSFKKLIEVTLSPSGRLYITMTAAFIGRPIRTRSI